MEASLSPTGERLDEVLSAARRIAVLGASARPGRPSHDVPAYLRDHGFTIVPVNPARAGEELFGGVAVARLADIEGGVDIVDVFRRPDQLPEHLDDILAMRPAPGLVWFQLGIRNDEVAERLRAEGIAVVQDRCIKIEHRRLARAARNGG